MELQFDQRVFPTLRQVVRETQTQEQTQEVRLPDGLPDVGRVLAVWGQPLIRGKEWRGSGMTVTGGVMAWVLYAPEDGTQPRSVETWLPFQLKWDFPETQRDGHICVSCLLRSADARSVSARKLMVRVGICVLGEALEPSEAAAFSPGQLPEDVRVLRRNYPLCLPREAGEKVFLLDEELTLPDSCPKMEKLLSFTLLPELADRKVMAGKVVFRGSAALHIRYRGVNGQLHTWDFSLPFSQYADLDGEYSQEASVSVTPAVTSLEAEQLEDGRLHLKAGLAGQYTVFDQTLVELVEDAYSPNRTVTPRITPLEVPAVLDSRRETVRCEQTAEGMGSRLVDADFFPDSPRQQRSGDMVTLELPGTFQALYYDEAGELQSASARWESTWELPAGEDCAVNAALQPAGRPQGAMGGGSLSLRGEVALDTVTVGQQGLPMVTALELGEMTRPDPDRPSLILRRAGGDCLWEIAKACGSTVEAIQAANKLQEEPAREQLLLIPVCG